MSNTSEKKRNLGVDLLSCVGVMFLLGLQYIQCIGFADMPLFRYTAVFPLAARWFCLSGAMLLAACMGYVLYDRTCTPSHFKILIRLTYIYILSSLGGLAIRRLVLEEPMQIQEIFRSLCSFTATDTSRITGMYFALVLAAPFLNAAFKGLKTKQARLCFVIIAAAVSTMQPILQWNGIFLIPEWCKGLFPMAGYLGGLYVRRYSKKKNTFSIVFFMLSTCIAQALLVLSTSIVHGSMYCPWLDSMAALPAFCLAICMLTIFRSKKEGSSAVHRFFAMASDGALVSLLIGTPLIECFKPAFEERFPNIAIRLWAGFAVVPMVFILCCTIGLILQLPFFLIRRVSDAAEQTEEETYEAYEETPENEEYEAYAEDTVYDDPEETEPGCVSGYAAENAYVPYEEQEQGTEYAAEDTDIPDVRPCTEERVHPVLPPRTPKSYSLDDILGEQGIAVKHVPESVDDLIAALTAGK